MTIVLVAVTGVAGFVVASVIQKVLGGRREAELKRSVLEAKGAIPQLEASVRNREAQITRYQHETEGLKNRIVELEDAVKEKENALVTHQREARQMSSELSVLRESNVLDGDALDIDAGELGDDDATSDAEAKLLAQLEKTRAGYDAMKRAIIERDERIEALEKQAADESTGVSAIGVQAQLSELHESSKAMADDLEQRDATIAELREALEEERKEREMLANLARSRSDANRALKEKNAEAVEKLPKLMETIKARNAVIEAREATIAARESELEQVRTDRAAREADIVELKQEVAVRDASLARQGEEIEAHKRAFDEQAAGHKGVLAELEDAHARNVADIEASHQQTIAGRDARIGQIEAELREESDNLTRARATISAREAAVVKQQQRIEAALERVREAEQTITGLKRSIEDRDFRIQGLTGELAKAHAELEVSLKKLVDGKAREASRAAAYKAELETLTGRFESTQSEFEARRSDLRMRDKRIEALEDEILGHHTQVAGLERELEERDVRIAELDSELASVKQAPSPTSEGRTTVGRFPRRPLTSRGRRRKVAAPRRLRRRAVKRQPISSRIRQPLAAVRVKRFVPRSGRMPFQRPMSKPVSKAPQFESA